MAAIPVTFQGILFFSDLGVGGGPMPGGPGGPGGPPSIWPSPGVPTHPIAGPPPQIWPSPGHPAHPIAGPPPQIWPSPGHPAHPIAGPPPGIWGGGNVPMPTPPIYLPPGTIPGAKPEHPIYIPPSIWPSPGVPTHPIVLPPPGTDGKPEVLQNWEVKTAWSEQTGWVVAIVPTDSATVPTPSS
jgi:hypothetical protein